MYTKINFKFYSTDVNVFQKLQFFLLIQNISLKNEQFAGTEQRNVHTADLVENRPRWLQFTNNVINSTIR